MIKGWAVETDLELLWRPPYLEHKAIVIYQTFAGAERHKLWPEKVVQVEIRKVK